MNTIQKAIFWRFFEAGEATGAVELTESIILRFDWENHRPLSLGFISISHLLQPSTYGQVSFELLIDEWSTEVADKIWAMLQAPPLTDFLKVGSYAPAHQQAVIPTATITQPPLAVYPA